MKITMIGHASLVVETSNLTVLMDPIFQDPHQEGLFDVSPPRRVTPSQLPAVDVLILSHRHLDHFDLRTLSTLNRRARVFVPKDALLQDFLKRLGFRTVTPLADFSRIQLGATTMFTTRSENNVPEYGVVFADASGTFWNQVDSIVTPRTVQFVRGQFPQIDLLLAGWQPMLEVSFQTNRPLAFPYDRYGTILQNIALAEPRAVAPGANGFCYSGASAWLNHVVFPVNRARFLHDARTLLGDRATVFDFLPGDVFTIGPDAITRDSNASAFVRRTSDEGADLTFAPVVAGAPLRDEDPHHVGEAALEASVERIVSRDLAALVRQPGPFAAHRQWGVIVELTVVFPSGVSRKWHVDLSQTAPACVPGSDPRATMSSYITASGLHGLSTRTMGWDYVELGGFYRHCQKVYSVASCGIVRGDGAGLRDPLDLLFNYSDVFRALREREFERWSERPVAAAAGDTAMAASGV